MITTTDIRERVIELNYYLLQAMEKNDKVKVEAIRLEINSLIKLYLKD